MRINIVYLQRVISIIFYGNSADEPSVLINTDCPYPATVMVYKYLGEIIKLERV